MNFELTENTNSPLLGGDVQRPEARKARSVSFWVLVITIVVIGLLRLGTPFLGIFFSYYILTLLNPLKHKWLKVAIFLAFVALACTGLGYTLDQTIKHLPQVVNRAIPAIIQTAQQYGIQLPFTDWDSLKEFTMESVKGELPLFGKLAKNATRHVVFLAIGIAVAISIFLRPFSKMLGETGPGSQENYYTLYGGEIAARFASFYRSFAKVMGAQLIISTINTTLTAIFIFAIDLPYPAVGIGVTFICGLLPIVGNLISNSVLVAIGFTVSPQTAVWALLFLITLHKLEYFLNSKIIGNQIKNPVWLTLIGLVLGERLMGIPGMILAPVILHFIKEEASQVKLWKKKDGDLAENAEEPRTATQKA